jgi:hypothetical protein
MWHRFGSATQPIGEYGLRRGQRDRWTGGAGSNGHCSKVEGSGRPASKVQRSKFEVRRSRFESSTFKVPRVRDSEFESPKSPKLEVRSPKIQGTQRRQAASSWRPDDRIDRANPLVWWPAAADSIDSRPCVGPRSLGGDLRARGRYSLRMNEFGCYYPARFDDGRASSLGLSQVFQAGGTCCVQLVTHSHGCWLADWR